jgi:hypothetical protein
LLAEVHGLSRNENLQKSRVVSPIKKKIGKRTLNLFSFKIKKEGKKERREGTKKEGKKERKKEIRKEKRSKERRK